jgi:molybdopterin synthase catalytic subunit
MSRIIEVKIQKTPLNIDTCMKVVASTTCGGTAIFVGTTRDVTDGKKVSGLEFEVYTEMALKEMKNIADSTIEQWPVESVLIHHREGVVLAGETAVIIIVTAPRRDAAFKACRYVIDTLKETVPIWKKEFFEDGTEWVTSHP